MTDQTLLDQLGFTREELQEKVVDRITNTLLRAKGFDEDGDEYEVPSGMMRDLEKAVRDAVDARVAAIGEQYIVPRVVEIIASAVMTKTNQWGEKVGVQDMTFTEYMVSRAEAYMAEQVDSSGKPKGSDSYNWKADSTRGAWLIDRYLSHEIAKAMTVALREANKAIVGGIQEAVKIKLAEVVNSLKVNVATK